MKNKFTLSLAAILVSLAPLGYLLAIYNHIPATVALHFNIKGEADRLGSKAELWTVAAVLAMVSLLVFLLLTNIHRIDPKKSAATRRDVFVKLGLVTVVFMATLNIIIITAAQQGQMKLNRVLLPAIGLMLAVFGNYMPRLKPNYFAGLRLPWTLENEENWRITHQVAGKWWFWGGLAIATVTPLLPFKAAFIFMMAVAVIITAVPVYTSWRIFKQHKKQSA